MSRRCTISGLSDAPFRELLLALTGSAVAAATNFVDAEKSNDSRHGLCEPDDLRREAVVIAKPRTIDRPSDRLASSAAATQGRASRDPMSEWMRERVARLERRIASMKLTNQALEQSPFLKAMNERIVTDMERKLVVFRLQQQRCERTIKNRSIVSKQTKTS